VFPRIFPLVAELGDKGDPVCESILSNAAESLTELVASVLSRLKLNDREIPIAKAGGAVGRSRFFDAAIDEGLNRVAPRARLISLAMKPAEAAAQLAIRSGRRKAHAG
jgi:N-acetylglucosamine kinase-like BadF-type ATPase